MIGAMVVLLLVVGGFVLLRDTGRTVPSTPVRTVDYHRTLDYARDRARFGLLAPESLPEGWRATSVSFRLRGEQHWHLGVLTDQDRYLGLEQGRAPVKSMLTEYVDKEPSADGTVQVDGQPWARWSDDGGDRALVRRTAGTTTLVVGPVPEQVLVDYVRSLR
jgi:Protein of unknown function (DUF4245)